jgi:hypothetical protein
MAIAVRATSSVYVNNANTGTVTLPAGSAAGDWLVLLVGHGFPVNTPTGFDVVETTNQGFYNGAVFAKQLIAADITAGSVTVTFTGTFFGHIVAVGFTGAITGNRTRIQSFSTSGSGSRTLTTDGTPLTGEYALYFAAGRSNGAISSTAGSALVADNQVSSSCKVTGTLLGSNGSTTTTWGYSVVPTGDYQTIIVISETAGPPAQVAEMAAEVLRDGTPAAQLVDIAAEVLRDGTPAAQVMEMGVEVLRTVTAVFRRRPVFVMSNIIETLGYPPNALFIDGDVVLVDGDSVEF